MDSYMSFSSLFFTFLHTTFLKHEKKFISPLINCSWWILVKLGMVWTHSVPVGTSWVQTIPRFSKITTRRMSEEIVVFIFYDFEKTVRKTGWSVRGFWVIIERFSRRSRENLEIITQKPRTDHPVFRTVCLRSHRMWNILFLGSCFPSQVKKFFIAVKKTTHIQGKKNG